MISSEVQRTLVKSPPELWSELSDQASLARHLSDLEGIGEIKVTKVEPEKLVEWEAEGASGSVAIKASGWGTKVTLRVSRELPAVAEEAEAEADPEIAAGSEAEAEAREAEARAGAPEAEPEIEAEAEPDAPSLTAAERFAPEFPPSLRGEHMHAPQEEPAAEAESAPQAVEPAPVKRQGFFARLLGRGKRRPEQTIEPPPAPEPIQALEPTQAPEPTQALEPTASDEPEAPEAQAEQDLPEPEPDLAAELLAAEEQVTAVLSAVLDRLGAAHHRPFSRA